MTELECDAPPHDAAKDAATALAIQTRWVELPPGQGHGAGGPPAIISKTYAVHGRDYPRLSVRVCGSISKGFELVACLKERADAEGWQTVRLPQGMLSIAGRMLVAAA